MLSEKLAKFLPSHNGNSTYTSQESSSCENSNISIFDKSCEESESKYNNSTNSIFDKITSGIKSSSLVGTDDESPAIEYLSSKSRNGKIDDTKQGNIGDCWVLAAINALNATQKGKELIKESLQYDENGTYVNFKGAGQVYVSNKELIHFHKYSSGDDDMLILELAVEKIMDKIANDELMFSDDMPLGAQPTSKEIKESGWFHTSIGDGGFEPFVMYLLSGKESIRESYKPDFEEILDKFANNEKTFVDGEYLNKDFALGAGVEESKTVKDINGKKVKLNGPHAYSVKYVDENTVTVINPWDSSKEITISRDVFLESFEQLYPVDLSDNAKDVDYLIETTRETVENSDGTKTEYIKDSSTGDILKEIEYYENGKPKKEIRRYQNGLTRSETYYRENGKESLSVLMGYYEDGSIEHMAYFDYDENGEWTKYTSYSYNKNGSWKSVSETEFEKGKRKIDTNKFYDENGNYVSGTRTTYKNGKVVKTERDTDGDGIYETVEEN